MCDPIVSVILKYLFWGKYCSDVNNCIFVRQDIKIKIAQKLCGFANTDFSGKQNYQNIDNYNTKKKSFQ